MSDVVLSARGLRKRWGDIVALDGVDLDVHEGEVITVIGPSGSGKSTLLRCLNALEIPDEGAVFVRGAQLVAGAEGVDALRARVGMVFQSFQLFPHLDVLANLTMAPRIVRGESVDVVEARARGLLARVGLRDRERERVDRLSGGQRQRVAIARALCMCPDALLFDEPTSALDSETVGEVLAVMRDIARDGTTMVVVTHEIPFAADVSSRTLFMDGGKVCVEGPTEALIGRPQDPRLRAFLGRLDSR